MACGTCPDAVTFTLRGVVQAELDKVLAIKNLSTIFSRALQDVAGLAVDVVDAAIDAIPTLPGLNLPDILGYLTCPLTPLALAVDEDFLFSEFVDLDPLVQIRRLKALASASLRKARRDYENLLEVSDYRQVIGLARKYANEFLRIKFDPISFAKAIVVTATVLAVCGEEEYNEGPYLEFANAITDFSLSAGVPSDLDVNVAALVQRLIEAEVRFKAAATALI